MRNFLVWAAAICALAAAGCLPAQSASAWRAALSSAARQAPDARIVVADIASGRVLASRHLAEAARTLAAPGSTLKPIALYGLIDRRLWNPGRRIACSRTLRIGGRPLNCSHPPADPMDARLALTWSCNTYFASVAASLAPGELRSLLAPSGVLSATGLAPGEATAEFRDPHTPDESQLALLGVDGVRVTPLELAAAYRWLALQIAAHPESPASQIVREGLADSASFGMAGAADLGGVEVAGKTGTASSVLGGPTHGWFVGLAPARAPRIVVAVYVPAGHGADAARVGGVLLGNSPLRAK